MTKGEQIAKAFVGTACRKTNGFCSLEFELKKLETPSKSYFANVFSPAGTKWAQDL